MKLGSVRGKGIKKMLNGPSALIFINKSLNCHDLQDSHMLNVDIIILPIRLEISNKCFSQ